jgi:hypothetical protein
VIFVVSEKVADMTFRSDVSSPMLCAVCFSARLLQLEQKRMHPIAISNWKRFFSTGALPELEACLAEEVIFESPVAHTPRVGKAISMKYLYSGQRVFYNASFAYVVCVSGPPPIPAC